MTGAVALGLLAAIVTAMWGSGLFRGAGSSSRVVTAVPTEHDLAFGATPKEVRRIAGQPTLIRGSCWLYRPKAGMVGAIPMGRPGSNAALTANYLKLCFSGGLSEAFEHVRNQVKGWIWITIVPTYVTTLTP